MKFILLPALLFSSMSYAEENCIQSTVDNKTVKTCSHNEFNLFDACEPKAINCYTGNAAELINQIRNGYFNTGDEGFYEATLLENETISTAYDGLTPVRCNLVIKRCE